MLKSVWEILGTKTPRYRQTVCFIAFWTFHQYMIPINAQCLWQAPKVLALKNSCSLRNLDIHFCGFILFYFFPSDLFFLKFQNILFFLFLQDNTKFNHFLSLFFPIFLICTSNWSKNRLLESSSATFLPDIHNRPR